MLVDVGQPFLDDAEESGLHLTREPAEIGWNFDVDLYPGPLVETLGVALQRGREPDLVEQGRMQEIGDGPNLGGAGSRQIDGLGERLPPALRSQFGIPQRLRLMLRAARSCEVLSCSSRAILRLS